MSEEISAGVRILLERAKSNPEELMDDYGKWGQLREAVYAYKEEGHRRPWIRGLRQDEIDLLYEAFSSHARKIFDDYVMSNVLGVDEEAEKHAEHQRIHAQAVRGLISQNPKVFSQPGGVYPSWETATTQTSTTSLVAKLKQELGIK